MKRLLSGLAVGLLLAATPAMAQGTPVPAIHNSPDLQCGPSRACTDAEFPTVKADLARQWAQIPEAIRAPCSRGTTYPAVEHCILDTTLGWLNSHPNAQAPWLKP